MNDDIRFLRVSDRVGHIGQCDQPIEAQAEHVTPGLDGAMKCLEHRLGRPLEKIHLPDYDYAGTPQKESRAAAKRGSKSRSPQGLGSTAADDLSPEELDALLNPGS